MVVAAASNSNGLRMTESCRYMIDSRLDRFLTNGHQSEVT